MQQQKTNTPLLANGAATEEVKIVQPVSLRQGRGARLSFLGGRKKDQKSEQGRSAPHTNGDGPGNHHAHEDESGSTGRSRSLSKENVNRRSFFRTHSSPENTRPNTQVNGADMSLGGSGRMETSGMDWVTDSGGPRESSGVSGMPDKERVLSDQSSGGGGPGGMLNVGSVRKRLSLLRLGKKTSKGSGLMGSLDEE